MDIYSLIKKQEKRQEYKEELFKKILKVLSKSEKYSISKVSSKE